MKHIAIMFAALLLAFASTSYGRSFTTDTTVTTDWSDPSGSNDGVVTFAADDITVTFNTNYIHAWTIRTTATVATKGTMIVNSGYTFTDANGIIFGTDSNSLGTGTISIKGDGTYNVSLQTATISPTKIKAEFGIKNATFVNLKLSTSANADLVAGAMTLSGSTFTITSGATFTQTGGTFTMDNGTTIIQSGGTLDLSVSKGFISRWFTLSGGTLITRAENALVQDAKGTPRVLSLSNSTTSNVKMYADQSFTDLYFGDANSILNLYTNGYYVDFYGLNGTSGVRGKVNIILEEGYDWVDNRIHFTNAKIADVVGVINSVTIGGVAIDMSKLNVESDGANGSYVNLNIPEPAEWAAIFGALVLAIALYRRK